MKYRPKSSYLSKDPEKLLKQLDNLKGRGKKKGIRVSNLPVNNPFNPHSLSKTHIDTGDTSLVKWKLLSNLL